MSGPPLTAAERSCLLRAARARLAQLHEDYDATMGALDVTGKADMLFAEINCVTCAIRWLWRQPAIDDNKNYAG